MTITFSKLGQLGRCGNMLFQIAATISTAFRNKTDFCFPPWEYEKDFGLHGCYSNNIKVSEVYREKAFHFNSIPEIKNMDLYGYWQSYKYFLDYKEEIIKFLTPTHHFEREPGLCSIHVRRGDYISKQNCHPLQTMDYYHKAMEKVGAKRYILFSDEINWCKKNFRGNIYEYAEENNPAIDLAMMAKKCESNIIANSSFSWWGSYLNQSSNKIVVAPKKWFGPALQHDIKDLLPKEWIQI